MHQGLGVGARARRPLDHHSFNLTGRSFGTSGRRAYHNRDLRMGTLGSIIKQTGLSEGEFLELL